ncbi:MAG: hypothetical protein KAW51_00625 [Candidatus Lokiarchaeota archaeon]|nr:hypothetical protein [Candidatus Lokiarchaeota archaeon]
MADCIDKILEICDNSEVKRYQVLIKLMQDLDKEISNAMQVRNCLILLVNLCFNPDSPDYAYNKGKSPKSLSGQEKIQMQELLKCEFNN